MSFKIELLDVIVELKEYRDVREILETQSPIVSTIQKSLDSFISIIAYLDMFETTEDDKERSVLKALVKARLEGVDKIASTEDIHGIDERMTQYISTAEFKRKVQPAAAGMLRSFMETFAAGVVAAYNDEAEVIDGPISSGGMIA